MKYFLFLAAAALSPVAYSAEKGSTPVNPLAAETLWRVFGSLALILVAIFVLVWALRRSGAMTRGRSGKMHVVDVLSLGQRERLVLVAVGEQQILLGVAPGLVQPVHTKDTPYIGTDSVKAGRFADALRRAQSDPAKGDEQVLAHD